MAGMTIRLTDIQAQKRYESDLEKYRDAVDEKMLSSSAAPSGWPKRPDEPGPLVNSHDDVSGHDPFIDPVAFNPTAFGRDPKFPGATPVPRDGTSHEEPKGYESHWTSCDDAPAKPFTLKK